MRKSVILFSQSSLDVRYVLFLYKKYAKKYNIVIVVVNVYNNYKFYASLNLEAKLVFVPFVSMKTPIKAFFYSFKLKYDNFNLFSSIKDSKVFYFSNNSDYITSFFIQKLSKFNDIFFVDLFNMYGEEIYSLENKFIKFCAKILFGIEIFFFDLNSKKAYQFVNSFSQKIYLDLNDEKVDEFFYKINVEKDSKKNLLFFESKEVEGIFNNYENDLIKFIKQYSQKYNIYIKPHPRLGYSDILKEFDIQIIDDYIPAEFLELDSFELVIGIITVALATINHPNKVCIINLFDFIQNDVREFYIDYLNRQNTGNNIIYLQKGLNECY